MTEIRFCKRNEVELLQKFIREDWKSDHILGHNKQLLDFQHLDVNNDRYNFVVGYNQTTGIFDAILGFIPLGHFDPALYQSRHIWLAIWKLVKLRAENLGLGMSLLEYLKEQHSPLTIGAIGINKDVSMIYRMFGYRVGVLHHYYIANSQKKEFRVIINPELHESAHTDTSEFQFQQVEDPVMLEPLFEKNYPNKSAVYYQKRYLEHPIYHYQIVGIKKGGVFFAGFVVRRIEILGARVLRIVDFCGNISDIGNISSEWQKILQNEDAEYIDFLCGELDQNAITNMGFYLLTDEMVLPNYFEPFEQRNVHIMYAHNVRNGHYQMFKGDSDQDRPNIL